jgi:hypothetical protein
MEGRGWTLMLEDEAELNMVNAMENEPESEFIESYSNT